jgi:hypothetical protein
LGNLGVRVGVIYAFGSVGDWPILTSIVFCRRRIAAVCRYFSGWNRISYAGYGTVFEDSFYECADILSTIYFWLLQLFYNIYYVYFLYLI